ncbi:ATP-binding response regulator [Lignipirellula cremea]|uniref:Transcriptional regulatory protein ZraR n=1 Tax=Lignipirellula cremea TaxID=2528010 RepID=A0A518E3S0_9BACT|nr:response regulator [Lignipirellula cremea]QDU98722.1 Transcriptional regulatory protein ZraR [Lignipirellula cremea]
MAKILVVDDTLRDRTLVGGLLKRESGWEVSTAVDGCDALEQIEASAPDVVVTDMMMPRLNGLELVKVMKKKHPLIPVILMTSHGGEELAVQALQAGAASYSSKEMLNKTLIETVENVLSVSQQKRSEARILAHVEETEYAFELENDSEAVPVMVAYLRDACERIGLIAESERALVGVALDEALVNAIFHGNLELDSELRDNDHKRYRELVEERSGQAPYRDRRIRVSALIRKEEARFTIGDDGPGFDPSSLPDPTDPANLTRLGGRGILLMRTFMDEVEFNAAGNEVRMIKRRNHAAS